MQRNNQNISQGIKLFRKDQRFSQIKLARILKISQPTLSKIEAGLLELSATQLIFLIQKYNLNLSFFLEQQDFAEADMIQNTLEQKGLWNLSTIPNVFVDPKFLKTETLIHKILEKAHH